MSDEKLQSICQEWQKRFRISDWQIEVSHCHKPDLPEDADAETKYFYDHKRATMKIVYEIETNTE